MDAIQDKVFIVTGASKGFGFAIAHKLLQRGAKVGLIARGQKGLDFGGKHHILDTMEMLRLVWDQLS